MASSPGSNISSDAEPRLRQQAISSLGKKRDFRVHLAAYLAVNTMLIVIWAFSGGFFWPLFPILGWGIGLAVHAWDTHARRPLSEDAIHREIERLRHP